MSRDVGIVLAASLAMMAGIFVLVSIIDAITDAIKRKVRANAEQPPLYRILRRLSKLGILGAIGGLLILAWHLFLPRGAHWLTSAQLRHSGVMLWFVFVSGLIGLGASWILAWIEVRSEKSRTRADEIIHR